MANDSSDSSSRPRRRVRTAAAVLLVLLAALGAAAPTPALAQERWVGTWASGLQAQIPPDPAASAQASGAGGDLFGPLPRIRNQTLRQFVRTSIGGSQVRVTFTNVFGTRPLEIGAAYVAVRTSGNAIDPLAGAPLTFRGEPSITIEAGSTVRSDAVDLDVPSLGHLAVDMHLPGDTWHGRSPVSGLRGAWTTGYVSPAGDHTGAQPMPADSMVQSWLFLSRVEVAAARETQVVVTLGDSITEGFGSTIDTDSRWPDVLARRLGDALGSAAPAVLNVAISGNRVLRGNDGAFAALTGGDPGPPNPNAGFGPSALDRFDRDVLLQPGVTHVIVLESINDIGMAGDPASPTVDELIAGHRALIQRARAHGLTVYGGTLTPFEGAQYYTEEGEAKRQAVNEWIRTSGAYDAVIDFDAVVRDSANPRRFLPMFHPGDWLHPNDEGYRAMGDAIDLTLFARAP